MIVAVNECTMVYLRRCDHESDPPDDIVDGIEHGADAVEMALAADGWRPVRPLGSRIFSRQHGGGLEVLAVIVRE